MKELIPLSVLTDIFVADAFEKIFRFHVKNGLILDPTWLSDNA